MSISTTAFLRILPTAMWRPGAAEHGVVREPRTATVPLTAIGIEIETVIEMRTVMDIMTVDCIAGGTNTIAMTTMTAIGIMIAVVTTAIGSTTVTRTVTMTKITTMTMIAKSNKALLSQRARRITKNLGEDRPGDLD